MDATREGLVNGRGRSSRCRVHFNNTHGPGNTIRTSTSCPRRPSLLPRDRAPARGGRRARPRSGRSAGGWCCGEQFAPLLRTSRPGPRLDALVDAPLAGPGRHLASRRHPPCSTRCDSCRRRLGDTDSRRPRQADGPVETRPSACHHPPAGTPPTFRTGSNIFASTATRTMNAKGDGARSPKSAWCAPSRDGRTAPCIQRRRALIAGGVLPWKSITCFSLGRVGRDRVRQQVCAPWTPCRSCTPIRDLDPKGGPASRWVQFLGEWAPIQSAEAERVPKLNAIETQIFRP